MAIKLPPSVSSFFMTPIAPQFIILHTKFKRFISLFPHLTTSAKYL